jgi:large subunit ribosomal protein L23
VSEKSYDLIEDLNTYTFEVDPRANKTEIKKAIQAIFGVKVISVNTMNRAGKIKRTGWVKGRRKNVKRAVVKLAPGHTIDIFGV